jgi:hypothetical protein
VTKNGPIEKMELINEPPFEATLIINETRIEIPMAIKKYPAIVPFKPSIEVVPIVANNKMIPTVIKEM